MGDSHGLGTCRQSPQDGVVIKDVVSCYRGAGIVALLQRLTWGWHTHTHTHNTPSHHIHMLHLHPFHICVLKRKLASP